MSPAREAISVLLDWGQLRRATPWLVAAAVALLAGSGSWWLFPALYDLGYLTDLPLHTQLLIDSRESGDPLGYTAYYALLDAVSGGSSDLEVLRAATVTILSVSVGLKAGFVSLVLALVRARPWVNALVSLAAVLVVPLALPGADRLYLGKFSAAIWHNSTTILAAPLSLAAFVAVLAYLTAERLPWWAHVAMPATILLCAAAKPNYLLALVPAVAVWMLIDVLRTRSARGRRFLELAARTVPIGLTGIAVLGYMYLTTFGGEGLSINGQKVGFGLRPMAVWNLLTSNPGWALLSSFLLPAVATLAVWPVARRLLAVGLAWLATGIAVLQFVLLAEVLEDGQVLGHGNWMWGAQLSTFVLYAVTVAVLLRHWSRASWLRWVAVTLAVIQVALGIRFLWLVLSQGVAPTAVVFG